MKHFDLFGEKIPLTVDDENLWVREGEIHERHPTNVVGAGENSAELRLDENEVSKTFNRLIHGRETNNKKGVERMDNENKTEGYLAYERKFGEVDLGFLKELPWQFNFRNWRRSGIDPYPTHEQFGRALAILASHGERLNKDNYLDYLFKYQGLYIFDMTALGRRDSSHTIEDGVVKADGRKVGVADENKLKFVERVGKMVVCT